MKSVGLIGSMSGKLGNSVAFVRNGQQIFRVYQPTVANPNTYRQRVSREKFKLLGEMASGYANAASIGLRAQRKTGETTRNVFMRLNKTSVTGVNLNGTAINFEVSYESLQFSQGTLPRMVFGTPSFATPGMASVEVEDNMQDVDGASIPDRVMLVVVCPSAKAAVARFSGTRETTEFSIKVPSTWQGLQVYMYAYTVKLPEALNGVADNVSPYRTPAEAVSDTIYIGSGLIN